MHFEIECCEIWKEMLVRIWWLNFLNAPSARWLMLFLLLVTISLITSSACAVIRSGSFWSPNQDIVDFNFNFLGIKQLQYFWEERSQFYLIEVLIKSNSFRIHRLWYFLIETFEVTQKNNELCTSMKLTYIKTIEIKGRILSWRKSPTESIVFPKSSSGIFW